MLELSQNPLFVERVRGIAGLYLQPPVRAMVLCSEDRGHANADDPGDEANQTQDLACAQPAPPTPPVGTRLRDDRVLGTNALLVALDAAAGFDPCAELAQFQADELHEFLREIDRSASSDLNLHLIVDYSLRYEGAKIRHWLAKRSRWHVHVAPTCAAWVYQAERWFAELTHKQSELDETDPIHRLTGDIRAFVGRQFYLPTPFVWPGSAQDGPAAVEHSGPVNKRTRAANAGSNGLSQVNGRSSVRERSQDGDSAHSASAWQANTQRGENVEDDSGDAPESNARSPSQYDHGRLNGASELLYPAGMSNLDAFLTYNSQAVFDRAVQLLLDARRVLIIGRGPGSRMCDPHAPNCDHAVP